MATVDADYFDGWYTALQQSPREAQLVSDALGLPPELESTSLLPWDGIDEVLKLLRLGQGEVLADLGCGRGGYGLELAKRSGASVVGVDFSRVAVARATERASSFGMSATARFVVGDLTRTGLEDASVDGVICVDAVQFAEPPLDCVHECFRILRHGGRLVVTSWEAKEPDDEIVPARLRGVQLQHDLVAAGFADVVVGEKPSWRDAEHAMWTAAAAENAEGDPGLQSLKDEGTRVLQTFDRVRRVCASGTKPQ